MRTLRVAPWALLGIILVCGIGGCGSKQEKAAGKMVSLTNALADRLSSIKTQADLDAAKPDLQSLQQQFKDLGTEMTNMPQPTGDEAKALEAKFKPQMDAAQKRLEDEMTRIGSSIGPQAIAQLAQYMDVPGMGAP